MRSGGEEKEDEGEKGGSEEGDRQGGCKDENERGEGGREGRGEEARNRTVLQPPPPHLPAGNHVAHVCERCYKVYVRLEEQRKSATAAVIEDVRKGREALGIPSLKRRTENKPPQTDAEIYKRSLLHHQRHLDP
eukprot:768209-Hanusia_phi.AAC.1